MATKTKKPDVTPGDCRQCFESLTLPDERLARALGKKLTHVECLLLRMWLQEERRVATDHEWDRVKDRIPKGH